MPFWRSPLRTHLDARRWIIRYMSTNQSSFPKKYPQYDAPENTETYRSSNRHPKPLQKDPLKEPSFALGDQGLVFANKKAGYPTNSPDTTYRSASKHSQSTYKMPLGEFSHKQPCVVDSPQPKKTSRYLSYCDLPNSASENYAPTSNTQNTTPSSTASDLSPSASTSEEHWAPTSSKNKLQTKEKNNLAIKEKEKGPFDSKCVLEKPIDGTPHTGGSIDGETNPIDPVNVNAEVGLFFDNPVKATGNHITDFGELFRSVIGIDPLTWEVYCLKLETPELIGCTEHLFNGLSKNSTQMLALQPSPSFVSPSFSRNSAHDRSPDKKRAFSIAKDQLVPATNPIKMYFDTKKPYTGIDFPTDFIESVSRSGRGIFGINSLVYASETLFLVLNDPLSAMVLFQKTKIPALSIPLGLDDPVQLRYLASLLSQAFSKVIFICNGIPSQMDSLPSLEPIQLHFSSLLQRWRCHIIPAHAVFKTVENSTPIACAASSATLSIASESRRLWQTLSVLMRDANGINTLLALAIPLPAKNVVASSDYLAQVRQELALGTQALWGTPLLWSLPPLTDIMKGLRPGELTVLTGPTGSGKTTILSLFSIDWCEQQVPTLWGSFEIPNHRILKKMMVQRRGKQFSADPHQAIVELEAEAAYFSKLPLHFMNFFGSAAPFSDVLETMAWAVQNLSIKHIILDNLQFMTSGHGGSGRTHAQPVTSFTKFDYQDRVISEIRRFATETNCHVTLVIHPRKEQDNTILGICSVSGTAKATQEADNVLILQKIGQKRTIDVRKNRFDGELGRIHAVDADHDEGECTEN
ncbi:hypothetical protein MDAP_001232 [Mitosporidium daphniae]